MNNPAPKGKAPTDQGNGASKIKLHATDFIATCAIMARATGEFSVSVALALLAMGVRNV